MHQLNKQSKLSEDVHIWEEVQKWILLKIMQFTGEEIRFNKHEKMYHIFIARKCKLQ